MKLTLIVLGLPEYQSRVLEPLIFRGRHVLKRNIRNSVLIEFLHTCNLVSPRDMRALGRIEMLLRAGRL